MFMKPTEFGLTKSELLFAMLRDWDPIGISDIPEAKDEYDAYADLVLGMLINENATAEDIANYLFNIATEHMALSDREMAKLCERTAAAIVALRSNYSSMEELDHKPCGTGTSVAVLRHSGPCASACARCEVAGGRHAR